MELWPVLVIVLPVVYVGQVAALFLHEAAHAVVALLRGWKILEFTIGGGPVVKSVMWGDVEFCWRALPFTGFVEVSMSGISRWKWLSFALAGPMMTLLITVSLLRGWSELGSGLPIWLPSSMMFLLLLQMGTLMSGLVPHHVTIHGRRVANDSLQAFRALTASRANLVTRMDECIRDNVQTFLRREQVPRALALLEEYLTGPRGLSSWDALLIGFRVLRASGHAEEARQVKDKALDLIAAGQTQRARQLDELACLSIYQGYSDMLEESLGYIDQAIALDPGVITFKGTKGSILIELGRREEGLALIDEVEAATDSEHDREVCRYYRALAVLKSGSRAEARELLSKAISEYPQCLVRSRIEAMFLTEPES